MNKQKIQCIAIFDTSIILLIAQNKLKYDEVIEAIDGCKPSITRSILNELNLIAYEHGERGRLAQWSLNNLINKLDIIDEEDSNISKGDEAIIYVIDKLKDRFKVVVVTADIELKNKLIKNGVYVMWYRKAKSKLETNISF